MTEPELCSCFKVTVIGWSGTMKNNVSGSYTTGGKTELLARTQIPLNIWHSSFVWCHHFMANFHIQASFRVWESCTIQPRCTYRINAILIP
jgi:hypothetical protein